MFRIAPRLASVPSRLLMLIGMTLLPGQAYAQSAGAAGADGFPVKPPRLIVPFSPGGISDFLARALAENAPEAFGSTMTVENRPGASGSIGLDIVARAAPDGYVLGLATVGLASNSVLYRRVPFDPLRDFTAVIKLGTIPSVIVVHPSLPVRSVQQFIELAKRRPDELAYGSSGLGTGSHLAVEFFKSATGTRMTHVPYKGTAQAVPDLLSGRLQFMFDFPTTAVQPVKAGRLRALAVTSSRRSEILPDIPTVAESGVPGFEFGTWAGIVGPAGISAPVLEKLHAGFARALNSPLVKGRYADQGIQIDTMAPVAFAAYLRSDVERWQRLVRSGHLALLD